MAEVYCYAYCIAWNVSNWWNQRRIMKNAKNQKQIYRSRVLSQIHFDSMKWVRILVMNVRTSRNKRRRRSFNHIPSILASLMIRNLKNNIQSFARSPRRPNKSTRFYWIIRHVLSASDILEKCHFFVNKKEHKVIPNWWKSEKLCQRYSSLFCSNVLFFPIYKTIVVKRRTESTYMTECEDLFHMLNYTPTTKLIFMWWGRTRRILNFL